MIIDYKSISFWSWLLHGSGGKPGYRRLLNKWLTLHVAIGALLALTVRVDLATAAGSVLVPLVGVLIGLCFAWAGNAHALLQAEELKGMAEFHSGGFRDYVFTYQAAIFAILVTLVAWALAGFQIFDKTWPTGSRVFSYGLVKTTLFALSSLTLRECWHVVLGAQWMLLAQHELKQAKPTTATSATSKEDV
jgi:hypothetical protein